MGARSKARKRAVDILFEADLRRMEPVDVLGERVGSTDAPPVNDYTVSLVEGVTRFQADIDRLLVEHAVGWSLERMPTVDRAVLRVGLYELLFSDEVDDAVAIDEAIELARALSTDDSPRFVNGVLGAIAALSRGS